MRPYILNCCYATKRHRSELWDILALTRTCKRRSTSNKKIMQSRLSNSADLPNPLLRHVQLALVPINIRIQDSKHPVLQFQLFVDHDAHIL
jgi:hypothetical protein